MTRARVAIALILLAGLGVGAVVGGVGWDTLVFALASLAVLIWPAGHPRAVARPAPEPDPLPAPVPPPAAEALSDVRLADAIADPVLVLKGERILQANRAAVERFGAHLVGGDVRVAFRHPSLLEFLRTAADGDQPRSLELTGLGGAGVWWEARTAPGSDGRLIVQLVDRTATQAADRTRADFVANASHELRTPLSAILGFVETLREEAGEDPELREQFLAVVAREATRMQRLVEDLLSLSRIESERFTPLGESVSLPNLALRVVADLKSRGLEAGRTLRVEAEEEASPHVQGDAAQLGQLLTNLVENGLKYGRPDTPVTIRVARVDDRLALLEVADEGEGVASEHLPRLTERFYRVDPGRSRRVGGTGLGLAIAKHIAERHRGTLRIASVQGTGTTVSVRLPLAAE